MGLDISMQTHKKEWQRVQAGFCCKNLRPACSIIKAQFTTRANEYKAAV